MNDRPRLESLRDTACAAVRVGWAALLPFHQRRRALRVEQKGIHDFVTQADLAAEQAIAEAIRSRHPGHLILGEESSEAKAKSTLEVTLDADGPLWIVDPLDGTANFIHGYPVFGISVACAEEREILAGAVFDPVRDELYSAARGLGATLNGRPCHINERQELPGSLIATGFPFRRLARLEQFLATFRELLPHTAGLRRAGAASIDLAWLASGRCDGFWEEGLGPWDIAAGALLIEEAGGVVTDFSGGARYLDTGAIVAATPGVHAALREIVHRAQGDGTLG
ncbi:MAG: inositol monophosphatase [Acidobacteriota bacterium]|nr:MAG: inositol monophosphatase [Acidobacteriota bacterium]